MNPQTEYLVSELWILTWGASVQRAKLFRRDASEPERREFREGMIKHFNEVIFPIYSSPVPEEDHNRRIERLSEFGTQFGEPVLTEAGYKIGVAQKALNLALKYFWCIGMVAEPPHCPVDRVVLSRTRLRNRMNWTQIVTIEEYERAIEAIREEAREDGKSIACWELDSYQRSR